MLDTLPPDLIRILVYSSGLRRLEDRTALVLSCRSVLDACGGVEPRSGRVAPDGGDMHWLRESENAGFRHHRRCGHRQRSLYFERLALSCVCCGVRISHGTGRISTPAGQHGRGVRLSTCVHCGPLVRTRPAGALVFVFGCFASKQQIDRDARLAADTLRRFREWVRASAIRSVLALTGMSDERIEMALAGSASYAAYVLSHRKEACRGLMRTIADICRRHWFNAYTWLPCARLLSGDPVHNREELYSVVLESYGGYPPSWPWSPGEDAVGGRERLADKMVGFYARSMMLGALFQRLVRGELGWLGDHGWLRRIRDAAVGMGPARRTSCSRVTYATPHSPRVTQLLLEAEHVGGYEIRIGAWHVTLRVQ